MKKIVAVLLLVLCVTVLFCGCVPTVGEQGKVSFIVVVDGVSANFETDFDTTDTNLVTLSDLMRYLAENNENFNYSESGGMVYSVLGITADSASREFWAIYTDCEINGVPYFDNTWGTTTVRGKTLGSATKGILELPLQKDATYVLEKSNW